MLIILLALAVMIPPSPRALLADRHNDPANAPEYTTYTITTSTTLAWNTALSVTPSLQHSRCVPAALGFNLDGEGRLLGNINSSSEVNFYLLYISDFDTWLSSPDPCHVAPGNALAGEKNMTSYSYDVLPATNDVVYVFINPNKITALVDINAIFVRSYEVQASITGASVETLPPIVIAGSSPSAAFYAMTVALALIILVFVVIVAKRMRRNAGGNDLISNVQLEQSRKTHLRYKEFLKTLQELHSAGKISDELYTRLRKEYLDKLGKT